MSVRATMRMSCDGSYNVVSRNGAIGNFDTIEQGEEWLIWTGADGYFMIDDLGDEWSMDLRDKHTWGVG